MIPKIIHYCWFGGNPKSELINKCIESWKTFMPDWEIVEWNEENTDLSFCPFLQDAYNSKKWAFVSDVVRLMVVYNYGGVYFDTDVESLSSWESLLNNDAFFFYENQFNINTGMGFGACKSHPIVKLLIDDYFNYTFDPKHVSKFVCTSLNTNVLKNNIDNFTAFGDTEKIDNILFISCAEYKKYGKHYMESSWDTQGKEITLKYAKKNRRFWKLRSFLRQKKFISFFKKIKLDRLYIFCVYDLIDYGIPYWIAKVFAKIKKLLT